MGDIFNDKRQMTEDELIARILWANDHPFIRFHETKQSERDQYLLRATRIRHHLLQFERIY